MEYETVVSAIECLDEDLALIAAVPVADTNAARQQVVATRLEAHERFAARIRALTDESAD